MSAYVRSAEIIRRLKLELPVSVTLIDILTDQPYTVHRDNLLALLTLDTENLLLEGQSHAALYAEMARAQRSAERMSAKCEMEYRRWQAQLSEVLRHDKRYETKKPTKEECESNYRTHADYEKMSMAGKHFAALAGLFEDFKRAFDIKGRAVHDQTELMKGHENAERVDDGLDRMKEMETLEAEAEKAIVESGSARVAAEESSGRKRKARGL